MLSICIKVPFGIKIYVLSIFEWLFYTGFTVYSHNLCITCEFNKRNRKYIELIVCSMVKP